MMAACLDCLKHKLVDKQLPFITSDTRLGCACEEGGVELETVNNSRTEKEKLILLTIYIINFSGTIENKSLQLYTHIMPSTNISLYIIIKRFFQILHIMLIIMHIIMYSWRVKHSPSTVK